MPHLDPNLNLTKRVESESDPNLITKTGSGLDSDLFIFIFFIVKMKEIIGFLHVKTSLALYLELTSWSD